MRSFLTRALAAIAILAVMTAPAHARSRWQRAETPHFVFYSEVGEQELRQAARKLELFDAELRSLWQLPEEPSANKLAVYLLQSRLRIREVRPEMGTGYDGVYIASSGQIAAFVTYNDHSGMQGQETLFHEYVHHFMFQNLTAAYPTWFVEGFAEYLSTMKIEDTHIVLGDYAEGRAADIVSPTWPSTEQFLRHPAHMSQELESLFYAESWTAVHYLYDDNARMAQFIAYVHALENGADPTQAFEPAFGMTPTAFVQSLHTYAHGRFQRRGGPLPHVDQSITIADMPESADDLMLPVARLRVGVKTAEEPALAALIEQVAARYPNDPYAQRARIRALLLRHANTDARVALTPLLATSPNDAELNYLMGSSYLDQASAHNGGAEATAMARRYFVKAFHSAPDDVPTLFGYVESYQFGDAMPESAVDVAVHVTDLAPQVMDPIIPTAYLLMQRERFDEAIVLLRRMAYAPHVSEDGAAQAQRLLQAAMHHRTPSAEDLQPTTTTSH